jgi:F420-non-reducing hydrogenase small subunit
MRVREAPLSGKPKIALYWASSCGGCEIAVLGVHERILDVANAFDIVFWPCVLDGKLEDVDALADGELLFTLFNGAIRNDENHEMAQLLRRKSQVLIAFGSCAHEGCIPGLGNFNNRREMFDWIYHEAPTTHNPNNVEPVAGGWEFPEGHVHIPGYWDTVKTLGQVVDVDYYLPGCPPEADRIWDALTAITENKLPPKGSVIGADVTVCDECPRTKNEKKIKQFYRPHEIITDPEVCLLEQGILCAGIATRSGCGALCPQVNMPCRGCYGPNEGVIDQGARFLSGIASVIDSEDPEEIEAILDTIADPAGTFYRFSLPHSLLHRVAMGSGNGKEAR